MWLSLKPELRYAFSVDPSAIHLHPDNDQFDWNKLSGVSSMSTLPRSCSKHGFTLYFGGTKTAPYKVTGHVKWIKR